MQRGNQLPAHGSRPAPRRGDPARHLPQSDPHHSVVWLWRFTSGGFSSQRGEHHQYRQPGHQQPVSGCVGWVRKHLCRRLHREECNQDSGGWRQRHGHNLGTPGGIAIQNLTGMAVDGAGNLYIGDHQNSRILVVTPGGVVSVLSITGLSPALGFPTALSFDAAGHLYIADFTEGRIIEISTLVVAGSTSSGLATVFPTGSYTFTGSTLTGQAIDQQGNIYLAARTQNNSSIVKIAINGVASEVSIPGNITPPVNDPQGVAVDAMGNLYIVDTANSRIVEITSAGVASVLSISGLTDPNTLGSLLFGVTVDAYGNFYIPDWTNNRIVFANVSGPALSAFASTAVGSTSSDSPKTATVTNLGNQALVFSANPGYTSNS